MARAPRASVSETSGQGVSRLAYQKGYALKGGAAVKAPFGKVATGGSGRDYGKAPKKAKGSGINVSYGDTFHPSGLDDIVKGE